MELSDRLAAVAGMVTPGSILADVGTDHAHIPIWLLEKKVIPKAIAMDINRGPLEKANENICACHMQDLIETRLCDGMRLLEPGEADCVIIAGMGGGLVLHILEDCKEVVCTLKELILQPQSELFKVREYLYQRGFSVEAEEMIFEDGKYYPMMKVVPPKTIDPLKNHSIPEKPVLFFGEHLLKSANPVLRNYLQREIDIHCRIREKLITSGTEKTSIRLKEVNDYLDLLNHTVLCYFGGV